MIELIVGNVRLPSLYLNKKLESGTLKEVLDSNYQTAYRLYLITNGIKELQEFADIKDKEYSLTAYIKTECGFIGDAKNQVWSITHLQPLLLKKPKYTVRCELTHLPSNKVVYKCTLEHKNQEIIYNQIQECIDNLNKIVG
jgi:hypothetical protein